MEESSLKASFGRVISLETKKECSVSERGQNMLSVVNLVDNFSFNWAWRRHVQPGLAQLEELEELTSHLFLLDGLGYGPGYGPLS